MQAAFAQTANPGEEDMFAGLDDDGDMFAAAARSAAPAAAQRDVRIGDQRPSDSTADQGEAGTIRPTAARSGHAAPAESAAEVDYSTWPAKELKRFLTERGEVCGLPSVRWTSPAI